MQRCTRCMAARYCGVECQQSDWDRHKAGCSAAARRVDAGLCAAVREAPPRAPAAVSCAGCTGAAAPRVPLRAALYCTRCAAPACGHAHARVACRCRNETALCAEAFRPLIALQLETLAAGAADLRCGTCRPVVGPLARLRFCFDAWKAFRSLPRAMGQYGGWQLFEGGLAPTASCRRLWRICLGLEALRQLTADAALAAELGCEDVIASEMLASLERHIRPRQLRMQFVGRCAALAVVSGSDLYVVAFDVLRDHWLCS